MPSVVRFFFSCPVLLLVWFDTVSVSGCLHGLGRTEGYTASGHHSRCVQLFVLLADAARVSWHRGPFPEGKRHAGTSHPESKECTLCTFCARAWAKRQPTVKPLAAR